MKYAEMNTRQKKAFVNIYHASQNLIGCLENKMLDYSEDDKEYIEAKKSLEDHEGLVAELYRMSTTEIYGDGFCDFSSQASKYLKDIRFCGKEFLMERCEKRICKMGF